MIATGGSLVTEPATYDLLLSTCFVVWLSATPDEHMGRVLAQGDLRPMADGPQAMDDLKAILESRTPLYAKADAEVITGRQDTRRRPSPPCWPRSPAPVRGSPMLAVIPASAATAGIQK